MDSLRFVNRFVSSLALSALLATAACTHQHAARVTNAQLPPPPVDMVHHSGRLWIAFDGYTEDRQCTDDGSARPLCFVGVHAALQRSLETTLWPAFSQVAVKGKGDELEKLDYLLLVSADLSPAPPGPEGPGWAARGELRWKLVRGGIPIASGASESTSRASFPYGSQLGNAAGEVIDALSIHLATRVGTLPERHPHPGVPLPPVVVKSDRPGIFGTETAEAKVK